jgi:hypothetical protein
MPERQKTQTGADHMHGKKTGLAAVHARRAFTEN